MQSETEKEFTAAVAACKKLFLQKAEDYGTSWRLFRLTSLTDQIFIKARRIRQLEEMRENPAVGEGAVDEYRGILNYAVMALMRLWCAEDVPEIDLEKPHAEDRLPPEALAAAYDCVAARLLELMRCKNHDYGEAWRGMRLSSITDQILVRVFRLKQMEDNQGRARFSEGADANYADIANYCAFALIRLENRSQGGV